jgi:hypothetical protein
MLPICTEPQTSNNSLNNVEISALGVSAVLIDIMKAKVAHLLSQ